MSAGPAYVDALRRVWDSGDAALPLDERLPLQQRHRVAVDLGASRIVDETGASRLAGGVPIEPGDALVMPTSGTTGAPKGVVLTHTALHAHATAVNTFLRVDPQSDAWLACLPLAHIGGLGVVVRAILSDTPLLVLPRFDAVAVSEAASRTTLTSLVPTALDRIDPALFRAILLGGSGDPKARPDNVLHTYGMTESCGGVVYEGRSLPGTAVRVVGGHIELQGESLLRCYRDGRDPKDANGWYRTGDLGEMGDDGLLTVFGRGDDLIISGGENIWPQAVEAVLARLDGVAEVLVTGRPDAEWGQRVVAMVVPSDPGDPPTLDRLRAFAKEHLPAFAAPREVEIVSSLPRTALGKVRRPPRVREP